MDRAHLARDDLTAMAGRQCNLGACHLALAALSAQLHDGFGKACQISQVMG
jgi:hypothetical protein